MADGARLYQILRGRLYERLPLLALALGLLDWREGEKTGTDGRFFYAPISFLEQAVRSPAVYARRLGNKDKCPLQRAACDAAAPVAARGNRHAGVEPCL